MFKKIFSNGNGFFLSIMGVGLLVTALEALMLKIGVFVFPPRSGAELFGLATGPALIGAAFLAWFSDYLHERYSPFRHPRE